MVAALNVEWATDGDRSHAPPIGKTRRTGYKIVGKPHWDFLPTIDWFWVKVGIKGGLAALISIVCPKWIHPPGPANVPTWAWLLIVLGRSFFRLGGTGDLRAFQKALGGSLMLAVCA